jgi:hypothetical protein
MRFTLLLIVAFSFTACSKGKNDLTASNLKGKVRQITISTYEASDKFGEIHKDSLREKQSYTYDKNGNLSEVIEYNLNGVAERKTIIKRADNYKIIDKESYNDKGELIQTYHYDYDEKNNLISFKNIEANKTLLQVTKYKNDQNGFLIESSSYLENGEMSTRSSYKNDTKGNCLEMTVFDRNESIVEIHKSTFDKNSNTTESEMSMYNRVISKNTFSYNSNNDIIEEKYYPSGNSDPSTIWKYDYINLDKSGNWTTKILIWTSGTKKVINKTEREITYY